MSKIQMATMSAEEMRRSNERKQKAYETSLAIRTKLAQRRSSVAYSVAEYDYVDDSENEKDEEEESEDDANILLQNIHEKTRSWSFPNLHLEECLPHIVPYSTVPEIVFYMANIVNCVCAIYMLASASAAIGWDRSIRSILIQDNINVHHENEIGVAGRALVIGCVACCMFGLSIVGMFGFYFAYRPLIYLNLLSYFIICILQISISLSVINIPEACETFTGLREPMQKHLEKFYTDSANVSGEELFEDHSGRINDMQTAINCCGLGSYEDYRDLDGQPPGDFRPPYSCCADAWKRNIFCNAGGEDDFKPRIADTGCEKRVQKICFNLMRFLGRGGIFFFSLMLISLIISIVCTLYHIRIQNIMEKSEIVYMERLNLFMPELEEDSEDEEEVIEPTEKRLIVNANKIRLTGKIGEFVDQLRKEYGMDSWIQKKKMRKAKKEKVTPKQAGRRKDLDDKTIQSIKDNAKWMQIRDDKGSSIELGVQHSDSILNRPKGLKKVNFSSVLDIPKVPSASALQFEKRKSNEMVLSRKAGQSEHETDSSAKAKKGQEQITFIE